VNPKDGLDAVLNKNFYPRRVLTPDFSGYLAPRVVPAPTALSRSKTGRNKNTGDCEKKEREEKEI